MKFFTTLFALLITSIAFAQITPNKELNLALPDVHPYTGPNVQQNSDDDYSGGAEFLRVSNEATLTAPIAKISVFPNPATNFVRVVLAGVSTADISIVNMRGTLILEKRVEGHGRIDTRFMVSKYPSGNYVITVRSGGRTQSTTVVIR